MTHLGAKSKPLVLFVCVQNAGRSQMAEGFATSMGIVAESAGTIPAAKVNPIAVEAMLEKGIDISRRRPKLLTTEMIQKADLVVTMGCSLDEACPKPLLAQMQKKLVDWSLDDPKGRPLEEVRRIRDDIETRVAELSRVVGSANPSGT